MPQGKPRRKSPAGSDAPVPPKLPGPIPPSADDTVAKKPFKYQFEEEDAAIKPLTTREEEIVKHVADGWTNAEIAERFGTTVRNIEKHMKNIRVKLKLKTRTAVAAWWHGHRIAELELRIREMGGDPTRR